MRRDGSTAAASRWTLAVSRRPPPPRHGVAGVHGRVHEDLLDLSGVGVDGVELRRQAQLD
jgi:hypothetical protein